jgi:hypothetical protein
MRLQLTIALASIAAPALAEDVEVRGVVSMYTDDDATTVVSPRTRVTGRPHEDWSISAGWAADVTTSASVDVTTSATPRAEAWRETRHEVFGSVGTTQGDVGASAGAVYSTEEDWDSIGVGGGASLDLLQRNVTLSGRYGLSLETVGRAKDANFARPLTVHTGEAGFTQVLSPSAIGQVTYTLTAAQGYQQSVYRYVPVQRMFSETVLPETHPDSRLRHAITLRANQHVFSDSAVQGDYRLYLDDWGVLSHTVGLRYLVHFDSGLTLRLRARGYLQGGADFYRDEYESTDGTVPTFVSRDREISDLVGLLGGLKAAWRLDDVGPISYLEIDAKADVFRYAYSDYEELSGRVGWVGEGGLGGGF